MNFYSFFVNINTELSTPCGVWITRKGGFMKRVFIVEDFMKHIADELRKKDDERRLSSEDYVSGYNDALEFVFSYLRRHF